MTNKLLNLLKNIELLSTDDLEKIKAWVDFQLSNRKNPETSS